MVAHPWSDRALLVLVPTVLVAFVALLCGCGWSDVNGFDTQSEYRYQVACGVLVWLYVMTLIVVYICRKTVERHCLYLPVRKT